MHTIRSSFGHAAALTARQHTPSLSLYVSLPMRRTRTLNVLLMKAAPCWSWPCADAARLSWRLQQQRRCPTRPLCYPPWRRRPRCPAGQNTLVRTVLARARLAPSAPLCDPSAPHANWLPASPLHNSWAPRRWPQRSSVSARASCIRVIPTRGSLSGPQPLGCHRRRWPHVRSPNQSFARRC